MSILDQAIRDQITRELFSILNVGKSGDEILAERLKDVVLKLSATSKITGLPASTLYRKVAAGEFPAPVKLGEAASGWLLSEVEAWIDARREERDAAMRGGELTRKAGAGLGGDALAPPFAEGRNSVE
jgi:prophage regulatory protein